MDLQELLTKLAEQQQKTNELLGSLVAITAPEHAETSTLAPRLLAISEGLDRVANNSSEIALRLLRIAQTEASEAGSA